MRGLLLIAVAAGVLAASPPLSIQRAAVARVEDGHPVLPPDSFVAGEIVHFSFYVEGFARKENEVKVSFDAQPTDPAGVPLAPLITSVLTTSLTAEDKGWQPKLRGDFHLPDVLSGGSYRILLHVKDEQSGESAAHELSFLVHGSQVETSSQFRVRDLDFYRTDEDERPLAVAAYRLSEEVHARFHVVGFQHGDQGVSDVVYGIAIADMSGHVVFAEPSASEDRSQDFYPKPYVPGVVGFTLKPGTPAGEYTLTVTALDRIGGDQKAEARRSFRLE